MARKSTPQHNRLLSLLPPQFFSLLEPHLEWVQLERDKDLYFDVKKINYIYFPVTCIVAILNVLLDGSSPEVATIGNDGLVGGDLFFSYVSDTKRSVVQSAGGAYRMKATTALKLFNENEDFKNLILKYNRFLFSQTSQIAVCNRFHTVDEQVCRFLLTSLDRWNSNRISLTHLRIANLLGVRRATVSEASVKLAHQNLIKYHRGCVTILDKTGLSQHSCECYDVIKKELSNVCLN